MANITQTLLTDIMHKKDYILTSSGDRMTISGLDNLKEALFRRLITEPGSLVHRPQYGVGIKSYIGAPATLSNQRKLAGRIEEQFLRDPRVKKLLGVSFNSEDKTPDTFTIVVRVSVVGYDEVTMKFTPFGGE